MKVYKFRQLTKKQEFDRLKRIIKTGEFWCSNFWELNDPMEGVFSFSILDFAKDKINKIYGQKGQYKICSFSGEKGFQNPAIWGYYTDGFNGVAIEVEIDKCIVKKIDYSDEEINLEENKGNCENFIEKVLLNKNTAWINEDEFRYLDKQKLDYKKIGKIKAIYFGTPYDNLVNSNKILKKANKINNFKKFKEQIIKLAKLNKISCWDIKVEHNQVIKSNKIN